MIKIDWSDPQKPNKDCSYDHVTATTPFGNFLITWKGWKEFDSPTVDETPWGDWFGAFSSVEEARLACEEEFQRRIGEVINE